MILMLEIKQESNAGRINSGSTAKSVKTQAFSSEVSSCESSFGRRPPVFFPIPEQWAPSTPDERIQSLRAYAQFHSPRTA